MFVMVPRPIGVIPYSRASGVPESSWFFEEHVENKKNEHVYVVYLKRV